MAFISEIHYQNTYASTSGNNEFIEVTLSPAEVANAGNFQIATYQSDGSVASVITLTDPSVTLTIDPVTGYHVYTVDINTTDPDHTFGTNEAEAISLIDTSLTPPANVISFVDIGGGTTNITATNGPAAGSTSTNIPAAPAGNSIQWDINGNRIDGPHTEGTSVTCFVAGTLIGTPDGEKRIEDLKVGDQVVTQHQGAQEIRWIGKSCVSKVSLQNHPKLRPVCIRAGALSANNPTHDLFVSQQHKMLLTNTLFDLYYGASSFLVKAKDIANAHENAFVVGPSEPVEYIHIFFENHEIIFANGSPSESFYPGKNALKALDPDQLKEFFTFFPEFGGNNRPYPTQPIGTLRGWELAVSNNT